MNTEKWDGYEDAEKKMGQDRLALLKKTLKRWNNRKKQTGQERSVAQRIAAHTTNKRKFLNPEFDVPPEVGVDEILRLNGAI